MVLFIQKNSCISKVYFLVGKRTYNAITEINEVLDYTCKVTVVKKNLSPSEEFSIVMYDMLPTFDVNIWVVVVVVGGGG